MGRPRARRTPRSRWRKGSAAFQKPYEIARFPGRDGIPNDWQGEEVRRRLRVPWYVRSPEAAARLMSQGPLLSAAGRWSRRRQDVDRGPCAHRPAPRQVLGFERLGSAARAIPVAGSSRPSSGARPDSARRTRPRPSSPPGGRTDGLVPCPPTRGRPVLRTTAPAPGSRFAGAASARIRSAGIARPVTPHATASNRTPRRGTPPPAFRQGLCVRLRCRCLMTALRLVARCFRTNSSTPSTSRSAMAR